MEPTEERQKKGSGDLKACRHSDAKLLENSCTDCRFSKQGIWTPHGVQDDEQDKAENFLMNFNFVDSALI